MPSIAAVKLMPEHASIAVDMAPVETQFDNSISKLPSPQSTDTASAPSVIDGVVVSLMVYVVGFEVVEFPHSLVYTKVTAYPPFGHGVFNAASGLAVMFTLFKKA